MKIDLKQSLALSKKELKILFGTPTAYVVMLFFFNIYKLFIYFFIRIFY